MIKKYNEYFKINENIESIFNKKYTYISGVRSKLIDIICRERSVSEKSFKLVDEIIKEVDTLLSLPKYETIILDYENNKKREEYCSEVIYDTEYK